MTTKTAFPHMSDWWKDDKPSFTHDCTGCKFLGSIIHQGKIADAYCCTDKTIIIRYGNDGPEYWSSNLSISIRLAYDGNHDFLPPVIGRAIREEIITETDLANALISHFATKG